MALQCWPGQGAHLVQGAHDSLLSEVHTDLTLVTKEGISIAVHKIMLAQCSTLQSILLSSSCCGGRCSSQASATVLLPDLPYRALKIALDFLYRGRIECSIEERAGVREVLQVLGLPRCSIEVEEQREGWVACTSCSAYLPLDQLAKHMVDLHVLKPAKADVEKVGRGDSVRCSYSSSPCNLDTNLTRIDKGFFKYLGQSNPLECVVQHYKEVHLVDMVKHLQKEWDFKIDREQYTKFESQLTKLLERQLASPMVSLEEDRAGLVEEEDNIHSGGGETTVEEEDEEEESAYSGGMDSPDVDMDEEGDNVDEGEDDPSSIETIPFDTNDDPPTNSSSLPDVVGLTIKSPAAANIEREELTGEPVAKKARKSAATAIKCRICDKEFSSEHFKRHVTTHLKSRWKEVSLEEGKRTCNHCKKTLQGREALIVHLATRHNELAAKLEEEGESLSDYEVREVTDVKQERILNLTTATKEDVSTRTKKGLISHMLHAGAWEDGVCKGLLYQRSE